MNNFDSLDRIFAQQFVFNHKDPGIIFRKFISKGVIPLRGELPYSPVLNDTMFKSSTSFGKKGNRRDPLRFSNMCISLYDGRTQLTNTCNVYYDDEKGRDYSNDMIVITDDSTIVNTPKKSCSYFKRINSVEDSYPSIKLKSLNPLRDCIYAIYSH